MERFAVCEWVVDGCRLVANINVALREYSGKAETPWFLSLSTSVLSTPEGLIARGGSGELNQWEDLIEGEIGAACRFIFVGRVTWKGNRELLYYIDTPELIAAVLQGLITKRAVRQFAFRCEYDPKWEKVGIYFKSK